MHRTAQMWLFSNNSYSIVLNNEFQWRLLSKLGQNNVENKLSWKTIDMLSLLCAKPGTRIKYKCVNVIVTIAHALN